MYLSSMSSSMSWKSSALFLFVLCAAAFAEAVSAAATSPSLEEGVAVLDPSNFDGFIASETFTLVEFYAPWCGHCKSLAPKWAEAAQILEKDDPPIRIAKLDADAHSELAGRFDVQGYPTIKVFRSGSVEEYNGPRETQGIVDFVRSNLPAHTTLADKKEYDAFVKEAGKKVIGVFRVPAKGAVSTAFANAARTLKKEATFGLWADGKYDAKAKAYAKHNIESIVKGAKAPMILVVDNKGVFSKCSLSGDKLAAITKCVTDGEGLTKLA